MKGEALSVSFVFLVFGPKGQSPFTGATEMYAPEPWSRTSRDSKMFDVWLVIHEHRRYKWLTTCILCREKMAVESFRELVYAILSLFWPMNILKLKFFSLFEVMLASTKFYPDSESELEVWTSMEDFLDFFFKDSMKSLTRTLGGTMSEENKSLSLYFVQ